MFHGRIVHNDMDYFKDLMTDTEGLIQICKQGSLAMQEWATKVCGGTGLYLARPDEVAEAISLRQDLGSPCDFLRELFNKVQLEPLQAHAAPLPEALALIENDDFLQVPSCLGYIMVVGQGQTAKTSNVGRCATSVVHSDTHRRVVNDEFGQETCRAVRFGRGQPWSEELLDDMTEIGHLGSGAYCRADETLVWRVVLVCDVGEVVDTCMGIDIRLRIGIYEMSSDRNKDENDRDEYQDKDRDRNEGCFMMLRGDEDHEGTNEERDIGRYKFTIIIELAILGHVPILISIIVSTIQMFSSVFISTDLISMSITVHYLLQSG